MAGNHLKHWWNRIIIVSDWDTVIFHISESHLIGNLKYLWERRKPECLSRFVRAARNPGSKSEQMV